MALGDLKNIPVSPCGSKSLEGEIYNDTHEGETHNANQSCRQRFRRGINSSKVKSVAGASSDCRRHHSPRMRNRRSHRQDSRGRDRQCRTKLREQTLHRDGRSQRSDFGRCDETQQRRISHSEKIERERQDKSRTKRPWSRRENENQWSYRDIEKPWRQRNVQTPWSRRGSYSQQARHLRKKLRENEQSEVREEQTAQLRGLIKKVTFSREDPILQSCRSIEEFHRWTPIGEGTYGVVYKAREKQTDEIVALKHLKMGKAEDGISIMVLREIKTLLITQHPNVVAVREVVVDENMGNFYIVMEYMEHDLKSLLKTMKRSFLIGEIKSIMLQLLEAVNYLHHNHILHRDLKPANLLLNNKGIVKVADLGFAREFGPSSKPYTPNVVTLWYRAPELLLGQKLYSTPLDMWSLGCIFGELLMMKPLFPGRVEIDQLKEIFMSLGTPCEAIWPGYNDLPLVKNLTFPHYPINNLRKKFRHALSDKGIDLIKSLLIFNPACRIASGDAMNHSFFQEAPKAIQPSISSICKLIVNKATERCG